MRANNKSVSKLKKAAFYGITVILWIVIWHIAAESIGRELFLPTPERVFKVLVYDLLPSKQFRESLINSLLHIGTGFLLGSIAGILLAVLSSMSGIIKIFLWLPIKVIKAVPVASFVILALLWIDADGLEVFIPAMIVLPILYINTFTGIKQTDKKLADMADLFEISLLKRIIYMYIPKTIPYVLSACSLAVGMAWKSGVAAEIIGLAKNSVGNELYKAKLYLMIPELFAWTIVIVLLSILCEMAIKLIIRLIEGN